MKKENQRLLSNNKMESEGNYRQVLVENFEREMTLVHLMLKGEYSQQKVINNMDNFAITEAMLSPSCKVSPTMMQRNDNLIKVPICVVEHLEDFDNKIPLSISDERIKVAIPTVPKSSLKVKDTVTHQIINEKVAGAGTAKLADVQVIIKLAECKHVFIPSISNIGKRINRLSPLTMHKVAGTIKTKTIDIQVKPRNVEYTHVPVPSIQNTRKEIDKLSIVPVHQATSDMNKKTTDIQVKLKNIEYTHISISSVLNIDEKVSKLSPVAVYKVMKAIAAKTSNIHVELKGVEYTKVLVPSISGHANVDEAVPSNKLYINKTKVIIQSMPDIIALWETV